MTKILILEDETSIRSFIRVNLKKNGFEAVEAASGEEALEKLDASFDLALMDVMLPGISGFEVCKRAREKYPSLGIIMLTAKGQEENRIEGLELGADDYIVKPFSPKELVARINALVRRLNIIDKQQPVEEKVEDDGRIVSGKFVILQEERKVLKDGQEIELTPIEYALLRFFMENTNKAVHRDEILQNVWGDSYVGDFKIVDVNIRRIRQKIEDDPSNPKYIEKVWGYGYRWSGGGE
ncbi:MAG: response regulator transcription factor [Peptococcaceae bacterium]|jgi:DNA-binding response OmpR family regulator|nr:response regulator transcription factor [Peptococcaceae bacterium]MBQ2120316.1 response regulator transcription factor [Peptococcaceae bacterium]MBQ2449290.1 response regulator transcription factor [Peptococcaceae bacterium]MBQ5652844.1 response regulator transcription factor [Peptococcaceae bacterium]MBQ5682404.1 response regulator transcription factor [Peptococcaceae bacterium]